MVPESLVTLFVVVYSQVATSYLAFAFELRYAAKIYAYQKNVNFFFTWIIMVVFALTLVLPKQKTKTKDASTPSKGTPSKDTPSKDKKE